MLFNYSKNFNILFSYSSLLVSEIHFLRAYFFFSLPLERGGKGNSSFYSNKLFLKKYFLFFLPAYQIKTAPTFSKNHPRERGCKGNSIFFPNKKKLKKYFFFFLDLPTPHSPSRYLKSSLPPKGAAKVCRLSFSPTIFLNYF